MRFLVRPFDRLTLAQLYALLHLRSAVFVVEQESPYNDLDGLDRNATHLLAIAPDASEGELVATARWLPVELDGEPGWTRLGRIVLARSVRGRGLGRRVMEEALARIDGAGRGRRPVVLDSQVHLQDFYRRFGFEAVGEPWDDAGVLHVRMVRRAGRRPDPGGH